MPHPLQNGGPGGATMPQAQQNSPFFLDVRRTCANPTGFRYSSYPHDDSAFKPPAMTRRQNYLVTQTPRDISVSSARVSRVWGRTAGRWNAVPSRFGKAGFAVLKSVQRF